MTSKKVLYISYDGMTDPLGQSQVIPYLKGLSKLGYRITIISFEKKDRASAAGAEIRSLLEGAGIKWEPQIFSRRPPFLSKLYDVWRMKRLAEKLYQAEKFDFIHCRSYIAADAGIYLRKKYRVPYLFDMRGFWVDERVDNGQWNLKNPLFRLAYRQYKKKEKVFFDGAGHVISLTHRGKEELINHYSVPAEKITVIPCCVDTELFDYQKISEEQRQQVKDQLNILPEDKVLTYLGSLGGWYLADEMLDYYAVLKKRIANLKFLFITFDDPLLIYDKAHARKLDISDIVVQPAKREQVPLYLSLSSWSIFFIKDAYSKKASSPTKQGEIMAMGIPVICNDIGDTGYIVKAAGAGLVVDELAKTGFEKTMPGFDQLAGIPALHIREGAISFFDLGNGIRSYEGVYKLLAR